MAPRRSPGRSQQQYGSPATDVKYTGYELNQEGELGLYHAGARLYDPVVGRFMQQDRFKDKYPSMTPYQYAANNPVLFIDVQGDSLDLSNLTDDELRQYNELVAMDAWLQTIFKELEESKHWYHVVVDPSRLRVGEGGHYDFNTEGIGEEKVVVPGGWIVLRTMNERALLHDGFHAYQHETLGNEFFSYLGTSTFLEAEAFILNYLKGHSVPYQLNESLRDFSRALQIGPSPVSLEQAWLNINESLPKISLYGDYPAYTGSTIRQNFLKFIYSR